MSEMNSSKWWQEVRETVRAGLRSRNMVQVGYVRLWKIDNTVRITDEDNLNAVTLSFDSEAAAIHKLTAITAQMTLGQSLSVILGRKDLPAALL